MAAVQSKTIRKKSKITWLVFTIVILITFFFRFYRLADHPLGIFFDPAINGLDAIRLMQRGGYVLFFPTNGGRESLFMYLLIPFIWLFNTTPFALRALTATISLLTVALVFGFLKSVSCLDFGRGRAVNQFANPNLSLQINTFWFAALGSLILATSYWHITISRLGQRPILVPMLAVPLFWFFLKGWATGQKRWFILAGIFMGLGGYTYSAARLLPIILVLAVMPEFFPPFTLWARVKNQMINLLIFVLSALIVYLPMAWYLLTHPTQFSARAFSVMVWNFLDTPADIVTEIGRNILRVLGFFCCTGSLNVIFGLPGYPGLPLVLTPFLLIGLIWACKNWRHLFFRLVALWWLVGVIASVIAIEAPHPLRMIVAVVPTAILVAFGLIHLFNWLQKRIIHHSSLPPHVFFWLPLVIILATIPGTFRAYFIDWTKLQTTQGAYDYGAVAIRNAILEHIDADGAIDDGAIYLPLARFNDSTLLFYLSGSFGRQAVLEVSPADKALVISPERNEKDTTWVRFDDQMASVLPPLTNEGQQLVQTAFAGDSALPIRTITGETVAHLAHLSTDPAHFLQQPAHSLTASFGLIRLTGVNYPAAIAPSSDKIPVTLFWQATSRMTDEYEVVLHLVDDNHLVWGNGSGRPTDWVYPTTFWRPNVDTIAAQHQIAVETGPLAPGRYWLAVSLFDPGTQQRLPLTEGESDSPNTFFIGPLKVPLPPSSEGEVTPLEAQVSFGNIIRLTGLETDQLTLVAGEPVSLILEWEALSLPNRDYTVFLHLLDENNNLVAGHDAQPLAGRYPTSIWTAGERIHDPQTLPTADTLPPGQYSLALGLYHQPTGERLPLSFADGHSDVDGRLILPQPVTIKAP